MSVKIMGVNYDDLAKLMGADLIVAGDAVAGEVVTGKEFYAGSSTLLTGTFDPECVLAFDTGDVIQGAGGMIDDSTPTFYQRIQDVAGGATEILVTKDLTYDANSLTFGAVSVFGKAGFTSDFKCQVWLGGVQVGESSFISNNYQPKFAFGTRTLVGLQTSTLRLKNYDGSTQQYSTYGVPVSGRAMPYSLSLGSIKA